MKISEVKIGETYNYLTVKKQILGRFFECECKCGTIKKIDINQIPTIKSCGCYNKELASIRASKLKKVYSDGITEHPLYGSYHSMYNRCYSKSYNGYLGGNIKVCDEWSHNYEAFYNWAIKLWSKKMQLVRIDETKDFSPDNCKFITRKEQVGKYKHLLGKHSKGKKRSKEIDNKIKATNLAKYGVEHVLQSKKMQDKCRQTILEKYGVTHASKIPGATKKSKETSLKKYGVEHYSQSKEGKLRGKQNTINSGQAYVYNGKMSDELAKDVGVARSTMNARIRKYGFELAVSMDKTQTSIERVIENILISNNIEFIKQFKIDKYYADFFIPDSNLVIEADGTYWHSDAVNEDKYYHRNKKRTYNETGHKSLFFRENEIENKLNIVESIILNKIGSTKTKVFARKCVIGEIDKAAAKEYLNNNHLMGNGKGISLALYYDNNVVAIMQITNKEEYCEVSRFCTSLNTSIIGGFSKLLKAAIDKFSPAKFITFIDRRYGEGSYLEGLGFKFANEDISFCWTKNNMIAHRMRFPGNSGYAEKWHKLWDCGQAKYELILPIK